MNLHLLKLGIVILWHCANGALLFLFFYFFFFEIVSGSRLIVLFDRNKNDLIRSAFAYRLPFCCEWNDKHVICMEHNRRMTLKHAFLFSLKQFLFHFVHLLRTCFARPISLCLLIYFIADADESIHSVLLRGVRLVSHYESCFCKA